MSGKLEEARLIEAIRDEFQFHHCGLIEYLTNNFTALKVRIYIKTMILKVSNNFKKYNCAIRVILMVIL